MLSYIRPFVTALPFLLAASCFGEEVAGAAASAAAKIADAAGAADEEKKGGDAGDAGADKGSEAADKATPQNPLEAMAAAAEAMKQAGNMAGVTAPVVNWRELAKFVPESVGDYKAAGELDGATSGMGKMQFTKVSRSYKSGEKRLELTITDTSMAAAMRLPISMAAMVHEDSTRGYKKGTKIAGHTALVEWNKKSKRSSVVALVADRFVVDVKVRGGEEGEAEKLVEKVDLKGISAIKPPA